MQENKEELESYCIGSISKGRLFFRRLKLFGLAFAASIVASMKWAEFMPSDLIYPVRIGMIALFAITFGWIALFFFSSLFGFVELLFNRKMPSIKRAPKDAELTTKTAILMPVYNEDPVAVCANLLAIARDLERTGQGKAFDFFILSDTTKSQVWIEEETLWLKTKDLFPKGIDLFYRHRPKNTARKSGNVEDFCVRWGMNYDYMIVLDADSLMAGNTLVEMAQLMQVNETTGIIQAPPMIINRRTLFSRLQQFAGRVYGPIVSAGLAYWQVWDSNYWGHNAIIRTKAFIDCCGLPVLPGQAPFGGPILSHDFVEAALIRRGGWLAWMLPELKGSFEECPPSMIDFAVRDRRWCQGNLQHLRVLFSKRLHPVSRIHFTLGIMSYLSSPIWFLFLVGGLGIALWRSVFPPEYFSDTKTLFPTWPVFDLMGTLMLFGISMGMLFVPKILGALILLIKHHPAKEYGGVFALLKTLIVEMLFSALIAPIMMLFQTKIVADILLGLDAGWNTQNRSDTGTSWRTAFERHFWHTILGCAVTALVYFNLPSLFYWVLPITVGLILSMPISVFSSRESIGMWAKKHKYFLIPEEYNEPDILQKAKRAMEEIELALQDVAGQGVERLLNNPVLLSTHIYMLSVNAPAPDFDANLVEKVHQKINAFVNGGTFELTDQEEKWCLYQEDILQMLSILKRV